MKAGTEKHDWSDWKEKIPGGEAEGKLPSDFDEVQLEKGMKVEIEHTPDLDIATEIAMDHLSESEDYYPELEKMEAKLEKEEDDEDDDEDDEKDPAPEKDGDDSVSVMRRRASLYRDWWSK